MFLGFVLTVCLWTAREQIKRPGWRVAFLCWLSSIIVGVVLWPGALIVQRGITALLMPVGLLWLGLLILILVALRQRQRRLATGATVLFLLLSLTSNRGISKMLFDRLEGPYQAIHASAGPPFDVVFLLGGGAGRGPEGQLNVSTSGDRIVLAARLYHAGHVRRLVCTGKAATADWPRDRDPGRMSEQLLRELAVPTNALERLEGRTTKEEMAEIRSYLATRPATNAGVITSAWHMSRALRLARAQGLKLQPLPADFRSGEVNWKDFSIIPESGAVTDIAAACKELIAVLAGR